MKCSQTVRLPAFSDRPTASRRTVGKPGFVEDRRPVTLVTPSGEGAPTSVRHICPFQMHVCGRSSDTVIDDRK